LNDIFIKEHFLMLDKIRWGFEMTSNIFYSFVWVEDMAKIIMACLENEKRLFAASKS